MKGLGWPRDGVAPRCLLRMTNTPKEAKQEGQLVVQRWYCDAFCLEGVRGTAACRVGAVPARWAPAASA